MKWRTRHGRFQLRLYRRFSRLFLRLFDRSFFFRTLIRNRRIRATRIVGLRRGGRRLLLRRGGGRRYRDTRAELRDLALQIRDDGVYCRRRSRSSNGRRSDRRLGLGLDLLSRSCWSLTAARSLRSG